MGEGGQEAWRETDLTRAIRAAEEAGLRSYRIEIAPDGTIAIVVAAPPETSASPAPRNAARSANG